jgi:hypothetical protein
MAMRRVKEVVEQLAELLGPKTGRLAVFRVDDFEGVECGILSG